MAGLTGIKGNGLISEAGGTARSSVKKGGKAAVREVGKLAEKAYEQLVGSQKGQPPPKVEANGQKKKEQEEKRAGQIEVTLRKVAQWQKEEVERIKQERERLARVREETLVDKKEEDGEEGKFGPLEWFKGVGKKAKGWLFKRKKSEVKPTGFKG